MRQIIPLTAKNQTMTVSLNIDGGIVVLGLSIHWNGIAGYWTMKITDPTTNRVKVDSIPLIRGYLDSANILAQYAYLKIGSAFLIKNGNIEDDYPNEENLGTDFELLWSDTPT